METSTDNTATAEAAATPQRPPTTLIRETGWAFWPIAFFARLPFAMMTVGVLMLVVAVTNDVGLGGLTSAAVGIGMVTAGPVIGDLVDKYGQRRVLVPVGLANGILLGVFPVIVLNGGSAAALLLAAFAMGLTGPQAAAMSRSRLLTIIAARLDPAVRARTMSRVMSYESAADETAFVIGPFLVGVLAALVAPWAPIAIAALLSLAFVTAFALHPTAQVRLAPRAAESVRAPVRAVFTAPILILVGATSAVGLFFGSTMTSLTAFAQAQGEGAQAGLLYGLMGIGSAVLALGVAIMPARFTPRYRWVVFATVLAASGAGYATSQGMDAIAIWLLIMGLGVGPTLVTVFSLAGVRAPAGRAATTMTVLTSALMLAQALSSALTGWLAESVSLGAAMVLPAVAGAIALVLGVVNAAMERRAGWRSVIVTG